MSTGSRSSERRASERGTSILEAALTATLLLMLLASVLQSYTAFASAARKQDDAIGIRTSGRQAVAEVERVLRSVEVAHPEIQWLNEEKSGKGPAGR